MMRTMSLVDERDDSDATHEITYPMLLSGPLMFRMAGLGNSVINRSRQISEGGAGRPIILVDVFQPWLDSEVAKLNESNRLGNLTEIRSLYHDLRFTKRKPGPVAGQPPVFAADLYECRVDPNDRSISRYYQNGQYVAFRKSRTEDSRTLIVDLLDDGKRYERLTYGADGTVWQIQRFNTDNELVMDEYIDSAGYRFLSVSYVDNKPTRWKYLDEELKLHIFDSMEGLLAYWLVHFNFDILEDHVLICEWAFKLKALVTVRERLRCKIVCTFHNSHLGGSYRYSRRDVKPELVETVSRIPDMDAVVVLTDEQRYDLLKANPLLPNIHVIPHVVEADCRQDVERDPKKVIILSRLTPEKGIMDCIEPFREVVKHVDGVRLEIWGRGPEESRIGHEIERLGLADSVCIRGFTDDPVGLYSGAAIALFPSSYEGQCLALMEAVAAGCVPVAFDFKYGARYIVQDGRTGFITDVGNYEDMMDSVRLLLSNETRLALMSQAGVYRLSRVNRAARLRKDWEDLFTFFGCRIGSLSRRGVS